MPQETYVSNLAPAAQRELRARLDGGDFEYRPVDHAHFSARGEGVVATLYLSGKLVVQGSQVELFVQRYLEGARHAEPEGGEPGKPRKSRETRRKGDGDLEGPAIGGDESGKGDYFGPLVVAAIRLGEGDAAKLRAGGIADSKQVSDQLVLRQAPVLAESFACALRVVDPPEYNRRHAERKNVALVLADLYREVIAELARPGDLVVIDQFSKNAGRLEKAMAGLGVELAQMHKAERFMSVAAASFLARAAFLRRLAELSDEHAVDLPKGAGPPVDKAARRFLQIHGREKLGLVAKLHFKTTEKVLRGR